MAFSVPPLPYDYDALESTIDVETMRLHHDKHHQAYVDNANGLDLNWQPAWVNHLSKEYRYVVRHWGNEPLTLQSFSATAPFTISRNECPAVLEIGSSCYFYVRFVPPKVGDNLGDLQVEEPPAEARLADLVWSVAELVAHLSRYYHLGPGDLLYTGTPAGVGPVVTGDRLEGTIDGLDPVRLEICPAE